MRFFIRTIPILICWSTLFFSSGLYGQAYNFIHYSVDDGLAQSQVLSIFQDKAGYLWAGTNNGGVSRYDGDHFITFSKKDGFLSNIVYSIAQDDQGRILFGTYGALSVLDHGKIHNYTNGDSTQQLLIYKILVDTKKRVWLGTSDGLYTFSNDHLQKYTSCKAIEKAQVNALFEDSKGNLWIGTPDRGIVMWDGFNSRSFSIAQGLNSNYIFTINQDLQGHILVGTAKGLHIQQRDSFIHKPLTADPTYLLTITSSTRDKKGDVWFSTLSGIVHYDGNKFVRYHVSGEGSELRFFSAFVDREQNLWFGGDGSGLCKLTSRAFFNISDREGLSNKDIRSIFEDSRNAMWIGTHDGVNQLNWIDNKLEVKQFKHSEPHPDQGPIGSSIYAIAEDTAHQLWMGSNGGLSKYDGKKFSHFSKENGLPGQQVYSLLFDKEGQLWIATNGGISLFKKGSKQPEPVEALNNQLKARKKAVFSIYKDDRQHLWFGTEGGVLRFDGTNAKLFDKKDGLVDSRVTSIVQDDQGFYWFATEDGVMRYDNARFDTINENKGLVSNKIYLLVKDDQGFIWVGTSKGLDKVDTRKFNKEKVVQLSHYGKAEGFMGVECNANAGFKDHLGRIWFGTIKGTTVFNVSLERRNEQAPVTHITGLRLFFQQDTSLYTFANGMNQLTGLPEGLELPYDRNHLTFDFIGISLSIPSKVRYQYMLEGADADWLPVTTKNEATYATLPPGEYTFMVKAMNNDGLWNEVPARFHFVIRSPWYQTTWAYALYIVAAVGIAYGYSTWRTRNLEKTKLKLESQVLERTQELRSEKEKVEHQNQEITVQKELIETKNRDITDSINYAKRIQDALLPPMKLFAESFNDAFVLYQPKDIVSGDFYWLGRRGDKTFIAMVDCTGHGVPGAFMSMIGHNLLNQIVLEYKEERPGDILRSLNILVKQAFSQSHRSLHTNDGMDIAFCTLDAKRNTLEFAGAQRPLYLIRHGELREVKGTKYSIGGATETDKAFENVEISLQQGDVLYLSSDGFADQFGGDKGKKLMTKMFKDFLLQIYDEDMTEQKGKLLQLLNTWKGSFEQVDDILVIGIKV